MKHTEEKMALLSVIVPCYNEEENIRYFYDELMKNQSFFEEKKMDVEIIYVDDGSKDKTVEEVKKLATTVYFSNMLANYQEQIVEFYQFNQGVLSVFSIVARENTLSS